MSGTGTGTGRAPGAPAASVLDESLHRLLGGRTAGRLGTELNLHTVRELVDHFPRRWVERGELTPIGSLPLGEQVTVVARVLSKQKRQMHRRRGFIVDVVVSDEAAGQAGKTTGRPGILAMAFFNGYDALRRLEPGMRAMFQGKTALYRGELTLNNPDFTVLEEQEAPTAHDLAPVPVYPSTGKLPSWVLRSCVSTVLDAVDLDAVPDPVPAELLEQAAGSRSPLPGLGQAYREIHRPTSVEAGRWARRRFALQEALVLQSALGLRRQAAATQDARPRPPRRGGLLEALDQRLPFELTDGQRRAGEVIDADLAARHPMSRLLQGEVGAGKTLVALRAMAQVVDAGAQAAMVAPTEVLATQHHRSLVETLGPLGRAGTLEAADAPATEVVLLTGSMGAAQRREALLKIASGQAGIVVGTHALLSETVTFAELGLAVVDEQHRFGVDQREALRQSNPGVHLLVMSATPIPRSVAMTVFGDLDLTVLQGLPAGRQPVTTHVARMAHGPKVIGRAWELIAEQAATGHQVFVVCPKIDPTDAGPEPEDAAGPAGEDADRPAAGLQDRRHDAAVEQMTPRLQSLPVLQGLRIASLHGRMDPGEQERTMREFVDGRIDVLVATTVIEVGVDVPNATVMAVLDADAFGLSTLHQLRGRVGRGSAPATCLLATRLPDGHPSLERLEVLAATQDGLHIARADLQQRGEGDVLGATQHGSGRLRVLQVLRDADLIELSADWVRAVLNAHGSLAGYPGLQAEVTRWEAGHEDDADYLQRG